MDAETYQALQVLVSKIEQHVAPATYQEDTRAALAVMREWMYKRADEYENPELIKELRD